MKIQNSNKCLPKNSPDSPSVKKNQNNCRDVKNFEKTLKKNSDQKGQDTSQDQNISSLFSQSKDPQSQAIENMKAGKPIESENQSSEKEQNFVQHLKRQGIEYLKKRGAENYQQGHYVAAGIDAIGEFLISDIPETVPGAALGIATDLAMGKAIKLFGKGAKKLMQNIDKFSEPLQDKIKTIFKKVEADKKLTKADNATISKALEKLDGKKLENSGDFDRLKVTKRNRVDDVGPKTTPKTPDELYKDILNSKTDVANIAKHNNLKPERIQKIKDYVFDNPKHTPHKPTAEAWERLSKGKGTEHDKLLLKHETAEMFYNDWIKKNPEKYMERYDPLTSHDITNYKGYDWEEGLPTE